VVESSGLLNRRRVKSSTGGSNPPLSAINNLAPLIRQGHPILRRFATSLLTKNSGSVCIRGVHGFLQAGVEPHRGFLILTGHQVRVHVHGEAGA
jgi:hypothetical protein